MRAVTRIISFYVLHMKVKLKLCVPVRICVRIEAPEISRKAVEEIRSLLSFQFLNHMYLFTIFANVSGPKK